MRFGFTFSEPYAESFGLSPAEVFRALVRELPFQMVRVCVYWNRTEAQEGVFDFGSVEWQIEEAARAELDIILAIGQKAPRWPEFHRPSWTSERDPDLGEHVLRLVEATVQHFRETPIAVWQVENEPYFTFGGPRIEEGLLRREIDLVRRVDDRPVMLTDSADKGDWRKPARWCDVLGVNLYTSLWNGQRYRDIRIAPSEYAAKARRIAPQVREVMVSELQAEPWGPVPVPELSASEAARTMNPERARRNIEIARGAGFETALFWGAEWWYWLRERGDASMWEVVSDVVREHV
jgi:hypothetical protein